MPATPVFTLTQDASTVFVRIQVPYVRVGALETHVDGRDFSFYCKPYLLRLRLPRACVDSEERPAKVTPRNSSPWNGAIRAGFVLSPCNPFQEQVT